MKIRFNGIIEKRTRGCPVCGHRATSDSAFIRRRRYFLPSGGILHVVAGEEYEVSEEDAEFLLSYHYLGSDGTVHHVFEAVDG